MNVGHTHRCILIAQNYLCNDEWIEHSLRKTICVTMRVYNTHCAKLYLCNDKWSNTHCAKLYLCSDKWSNTHCAKLYLCNDKWSNTHCAKLYLCNCECVQNSSLHKTTWRGGGGGGRGYNLYGAMYPHTRLMTSTFFQGNETK